MRIYPLGMYSSYTNKNTPHKKTNIQTPSEYKPERALYYGENISFGKTLNYKDFLISMKQAYKNKSIKNVIFSTISDPKNRIGSGFCADAYGIPQISDYIIRIERKYFTPQSFIQNPITEAYQNTLAPNFGQYIASNGHGFFINKKVQGESHSLPDWAFKIRQIQNGEDLTHHDAKIIFNKIKTISQYPLSSFEELAQNIQKLNQYTKSEIDIINPNNLIVDADNQKFGIIDLWYKHKGYDSPETYNGMDSMINLMLDPFSHTLAANKLSNSDRENFTQASYEIIQKTLISGEKAGLKRTNENALKIYIDFDEKRSINFARKAYLEFLQMYKDLLL